MFGGGSQECSTTEFQTKINKIRFKYLLRIGIIGIETGDKRFLEHELQTDINLAIHRNFGERR